ncbi:MAG: hypothetical protein R2753_05525 [Chitinophagales bacterium]
MKQRFLFIGILLFFISSDFIANAQNDAQYNNTQFGLKGMLLSGSLVAGDDDASMIYYNPAAIHYEKQQALDISLLVPNIERIRLKNAFGVRSDEKNIDFRLLPNLVSFKLSFINNPKIGMAATLLRKNDFNNTLRFNTSAPLEVDVMESYFEYNYQRSETWLGLGISYEVNPKFHIGFSQFTTIKSLSYEQLFYQTIKVNPESNEPKSITEDNLQANANAFLGLISKIGLSYKSERLNLGITLTTPTYAYLIKSGEYRLKTIYKAPEDDALNELSNTATTNNVNLKTPFSIAAGLIFKIKEVNTINFSSEFFAGIPAYSMIKFNEIDHEGLETNARPLINFALGWQIRLNQQFSYLGGFRTDFNFSRDIKNANYQLQTSDWNIYHFSSGINFLYKNSKFTVGLDYGFSFEKIDPYTNLSTFNEPNIRVNANNARINYQSYTILLTYGFLIDEIKDKIDKNKQARN